MARKKRKTPADYPTLGFRVSEGDKAELTALIDDKTERLNSKLKEDESRITKSEIVATALRKGLKILKPKDFE